MRHPIVFTALVLLCVSPYFPISYGEGVAQNSSAPHHCISGSLQVESIVAPQVYLTEHHSRNSERVGVSPGGTTTKLPFQSMRIFVDTSLLMADDENTCYSSGKWVKIGKPTTAPPTPRCSVSVSNNCWKLCEELDVLTTKKAAYISEKLIPHAVNYLQNVIKTNRLVRNLMVPKSTKGCSEHITIPEHYSTKGIPDADLALIVTARPTMQRTFAWAIECASDQSGRPVFGLINIGPEGLDMATNIDYYFRIVVHEMTHVLGFNNAKFDLFRDPQSGNRYHKVTLESTSDRGVKVEKIITPRALAAAREHFGCANLDGVLLEDGGGHSTSHSHWEKRVFRNEYMTGTADQGSVFSKITLAFLEGIPNWTWSIYMGWYQVDYSQAEHLDWGKSMGCQFVEGSCAKWKSYGYFCAVPDAKSCTSNRKSLGYCNLSGKVQPPPAFRYFDKPNLGGTDELADYCPYIQSFSNGLCSDISNKPPHADVIGSEYGPDSICFESSLGKFGYSISDEIQPTCHNYRCTTYETLEVEVGGDWYECPFDGVLEEVDGFNGLLKCPDENFCANYGTNFVDHSPSAKKSIFHEETSLYKSLFRSGASDKIAPNLLLAVFIVFMVMALYQP